MVAAFQVSEILGRSGYHASTVLQRCERLVADRGDPASGTVLLGHLLHEVREGSKTKQPGAGTSRMRAVLFKAVADWLSVAPCSLQREEAAVPGAAGVTWNSVQVDGDGYVVDIMFEPGALYEDGSGKACEYLRRLRQECEEAVAPSKSSKARKTESAAPSLQQNLGGRMLRPSWHVEPWEVEFDRRDRAGRGGFGEVFQGTWAGQQTAIKEVRDASPTDADVCDFVLEISLLSRLSHPNIVRFWRGCVDLRGGHRTLLLVTEWMDRGVLSQLLHESQANPELAFMQYVFRLSNVLPPRVTWYFKDDNIQVRVAGIGRRNYGASNVFLESLIFQACHLGIRACNGRKGWMDDDFFTYMYIHTCRQTEQTDRHTDRHAFSYV